MKRRKFLFVPPAAALAAAGCANLVTSEPDPVKNYRLSMVRKGLPTQKYATVGSPCKECEAFDSIHVEEQTLLASEHAAIRRWREQVLALEGYSPLAQLEGVNEAVNRDVRYVPDYEHWKVRDKWGFPVESLEQGGDCEDFALLKFESLKLLGWREESLLLLVGVSDINGPKQAHAVLLVELDNGAQLLLDSITDFILPPREDHHFFPIYGVNPAGYYHVAV